MADDNNTTNEVESDTTEVDSFDKEKTKKGLMIAIYVITAFTIMKLTGVFSMIASYWSAW